MHLKKIMLCCGLWYFSGLPLFAQQYLVDSIEQVLQSEQNPIQRIDLHLGLIRAHSFAGNDTALVENLKITELLCKENSYPDGEVTVILFKSLRALKAGKKFEESLRLKEEALELALASGSKAIQVFALYHLAEYYIYRKNDYEKGQQILAEALQLQDDTVNDKHLGNIHKIIGIVHKYQENDSLAIVHFNQALSYFERVATHPFINSELQRVEAMVSMAYR